MLNHTWPVALVHQLPNLLAFLLAKEHCQSLERLQLISLDIKVLSPKVLGPAHFAEIKLLETLGQKLELTGCLMVADSLIAQVKINYFKRGERKFFRGQPWPHGDSEEALLPISLTDITQFFSSRDQYGSFFTDQNLSELNGIMQPLVPSHMIIAMMLERAVLEFPKAAQFSLEFLEGVKIDEALSIVKVNDDQGHRLVLLASSAQAVQLYAQ